MPIAVTEEHESLRRTAERWLQTHCPPAEPRSVAEAPEPAADLPAVWEKMAAQGWLGLHLPEAYGGQGFTLAEVAVVLEELGHALFPGPALPTLLVSAALARHHDTAVRDALLPGLADGTVTAAVALGAPGLRWELAENGALSISGAVRPVLGLPTARLVLVPLDRDDGGAVVAARPRRPRRRGVRGGAAGARRHPPRREARDRGGRHRPPDGATTSRCPTPRCAAWPSSWPPRRARGSPAGASRPPRSTPRCVSSSAGPSASSRRSSTRWPTCWSPSSSAPRWPGTPQRRGARTRRDGGNDGRRAAVTSAHASPAPWHSRPPPTAPSSASRSSAASASPGSTTRTST